MPCLLEVNQLTINTVSMLGNVLLNQNKLDEAEPLLLDDGEGVRDAPRPHRVSDLVDLAFDFAGDHVCVYLSDEPCEVQGVVQHIVRFFGRSCCHARH